MGGIEKEELANRVQAATREEQVIMAMLLNDDVLWNELNRRYMVTSQMIRKISNTLKEG